MKYLIQLFAIVLGLSACGAPQQPANEIPQDLEGKRQLLRQKQAELKSLSDKITQLQEEIEAQDPNLQSKHGRLVTTMPVERQDFKHYVEIQGAVEADDFIDVTTEVPGRILTMPFDEGDPIRKGQLVATLDLEQVNKQIAELETSLDLANTVFERQSRLWEQNIGSEIQYLEAKNNKERLEKSLETLNVQLGKAKVYAPANGVVERVNLQSGELASPGMPILQILNTNKLKVAANVPENYLKSVRRGDEVLVKFPALNSEQKASVSLIGRVIDPSNRTFAVEANINASSGLIKPNLLAIMMINDLEEKNVVTVPLETVQQEVSGRDFVFVKADGEKGPIAKKVYVKTGRSYDGNIVITEGLEGGEELIMEGARGLAENELLEIKNQATNG